jgi:hypothetical protein
MQLKEEQFAALQSAEGAISTRLPEVDLLETGLGRKELEPIRVSHTDECFHGSKVPRPPSTLAVATLALSWGGGLPPRDYHAETSTLKPGNDAAAVRRAEKSAVCTAVGA